MADLSITAASVVAASTATTANGTAGATITAGVPVYKDSNAANVLKPTDADSSATTAAAVGIALHAAATGQPLKYITAGSLTIGATIGKGTVYICSGGAGLICPIGDLASADYLTILGYGTDTATLMVDLNATGVLVP